MSTSQLGKESNQDFRENITLDDIPAAGQTLLTNYSGVTPDTLLHHILNVRDRAFKEVPWPCIGHVKFLDDEWTGVEYFEKNLLPRLRAGATLLDAGCGLAQDLRFLVYNWGIDSSQLAGLDLSSVLPALGHELFRDKDKFKGHFLTVDLINPFAGPDYEKFKGSFDLIHASQLMHCFELDDMFTVAKNVVGLTRGTGAMIAGYQLGSSQAGSYKVMTSVVPRGSHYRHSESSWNRFWQEIGEATGYKFQVSYEAFSSAVIDSIRSAWWARDDPGVTYFRFIVRIL